jgi:hypothetical protein
MDSFIELEDNLFCVKCGKKIKSGHYFGNKGPYGICCYKKLYGTLGFILKRRRDNLILNKEKCPVTGAYKECANCLLIDECKHGTYKNIL